MSAKKSKKNKKLQGNKVNEEGNRLKDVTLKKVSEKLEVPYFNTERVEPCNAAKQAGHAAVLRSLMSDQSPSSSKDRHSSDSEVGGLNKKLSRVNTAPKTKNKELLAVQGVFFTCPLLGADILPENEWKDRILRHLKRQLEVDKVSTSCLMIHSLNRASETKNCIQTLETVINNIILHPTDDKFKKIRMMNKVFQEKVGSSVGAVEFLESVGFVKEKDNDSEDCYVYAQSEPDISHLKELLQLLKNTKPIKLELYRNVSVLKPSQVKLKVDLPDEFFVRTLDEIKHEQELRSISVEKAMTLRTKEMRATSGRPKTTNHYPYSLIRIRFPDGLILQATFGTFETLKVLKNFVRDCINDSVGSFKLTTALGVALVERDDNKSLNELNLMPAVLLTFVPSSSLRAGQSYFVPALQQKKS